MILSVGQVSMLLALFFAGLALAAFLLAALRRDSVAARAGRDSFLAAAACMVVALATLIVALLARDFSLGYVARLSDRNLSTLYTVAAVWAGAEGSLLFWAAISAVIMAAVVAAGPMDRRRAVGGAIMATVVVLLLVNLHYDAAAIDSGRIWPPEPSPFRQSDFVCQDGLGLNLALQVPAMILHPPLLFAGYAFLAVPFALAFTAFIAGRLTERLDLLRRFLLLGWTFLTFGNVLGAWWAYTEQGWGGYWAWDAVENSSLMPWLAAAAALHSLAVTRRTGHLAATSLVLATVPFLLCVLATYITRGGLVASVHAYAASDSDLANPLAWLIAHSYLVFLLAATVGLVVLAAWRRPGTRDVAAPLHGSARRRAIITMMPAVLLLTLTFGVLEGTIGPTIRSLASGDRYGLDAARFDLLAAWFAVAALAALAVAPYMISTPSRRLAARQIAVQLLCAAVAVVAQLALAPDFPPLATAVAALAAATLAATVLAARNAWQSMASAAGWLAHVGFLIVVVAAAGSHLVHEERRTRLAEGQTVVFAGYTLQLESVTPNKPASESDDLVTTARLHVLRGCRQVGVIEPTLRTRLRDGQTRAEVAIHSSPAGDLYAVLEAHRSEDDLWPITLHRSALMLWLWVGCAMLALAGLLAAFARDRSAKPAGGEP